MRSPHTSYRCRGERVIEPIKWMRSPHTSNRWRGERVIEPIKCMRSPHPSYRWRGERDIEPIKCMRSPHPSYRWRGERVMEPIKCMRSPHTSNSWRGERVKESIKCMRSPHTSYRWRGGERDRANQVYALTTHQLQVERRERHQIKFKSLLLSHHHSTSALVSEILMSVAPDSAKKQQQFTYGQTVQKKQQTIYIWTDSEKKLHWSIYSAPDSAKKTTTIYIWTVHIYRLYRRQCAEYTYIYSVHIVYYKDTLNYQRHIIHCMGTSTLCTVSIHNAVYT